MSQPLIPPFGKKVNLARYSTRHDGSLSRDAGHDELSELQTRLDELQDQFIADGRFALLIILQAIDAGGKDGTIRGVFSEVDPLGMRAIGFKVPTEEEISHDFLWRIHAQTPGKGQIAIFNRSHYEDVVAVRVKELVPREVWEKRYGHINAFENMLTDEGTVILKFFLHISKEEQRQRLQERVDNPAKRWKFRHGDLDDRARWDDFQAAFEDMLTRCNTEAAPWHVIPADQNWYRNLLVARVIVEKLESLSLRFPEPETAVSGIIVE